MAKKRTKKDKIQAITHRKIPVYNIDVAQVEIPAVVGESKPESDATALLGYPTKLLYRDLLRSLAITLILVVLLLGIFFFIRYN